ncbi:hypothetical protein [Desulfobacula sp.]
MNPDKLPGRLSGINQRLLQQRQQRIPPLRDDKIITAWNGMMITAFAQAGDILGGFFMGQEETADCQQPREAFMKP